jgi:predicted outer membrane lipoprotein
MEDSMHAYEDGSEQMSRFPRAWALGITAACAIGVIVLTAVRKADAPAADQKVPTVTVEAQGADHATVAPKTPQAKDKPVLAIVTTSEPAFARIAADQPQSKKPATSR